MSAVAMPEVKKKVRGGSFLVEEQTPEDVFTPEDFSAEQKQIAETTLAFSEEQVLTRVKEIEAKDFAVSIALMRQAGELGLLGVDIDEEHGGLEMDKITSTLVAENCSLVGSFSVTISAHTCIGSLPLVWYGTPEQKNKYLPKLASGEWIAAYALSEASAGSDAMNIRTQAKLSDDGTHYVLNGEKMWISNAGMASLFTVFAQIEGLGIACFLIEKGTPGFTVAPEEHKLGIRGSSTCALILNDVKVPVENVLGTAGKGHHIAFNILNVGRYKLAASAIGGSKASLKSGIKYAKGRVAFGKPISSFGLIQEMLADVTSQTYAGESALYRAVEAIDGALSGLDKKSDTYTVDVQKRIEDFAVECSILKVWGSELVCRTTDAMLQVHGGYGYVEEFSAERSWRDARINRIFEGTNEINRLIITGWTMKRAMSGKIPLLPAIQKVMDEVMAGPGAKTSIEGELGAERALLASAKKLGLFCSGSAFQKFGEDLQNQQEVMGAMADIIAEVYVLESAILRTEKMGGKSQAALEMTKYYAARSFDIVERSATRIISAVAEGDMLRTQMAIVRRLTKFEPTDTIAMGRKVAERVVDAGRYVV